MLHSLNTYPNKAYLTAMNKQAIAINKQIQAKA